MWRCSGRIPLRFLASVAILVLLSGIGPPGRPKRKREGMHMNLRAAQLVDPDVWAAEPDAPRDLDLSAFSRALLEVCDGLSPALAERYARAITKSATTHGEDPFLLAALMVHASRCVADTRDAAGVGLTGLQPAMYQQDVQADTLHYTLPGGQEREVILASPLAEAVLLVPEHNLAWAAALLAMWREQESLSEAQFRQAPHRHYVSHFLWGDEVPSAREEDRVFTQRRRLLAHYAAPTSVASVHALGVEWSAPLEAAPRVVSSKPGASRDQGRRRHRGVDVEAMPGEPVLAMADGTVIFSGVDLPGRGRNRNLPPANIGSVRRARLGKGGRYVCISHVEASADVPSLSSCYMHLEDVLVAKGQVVSRGEVIGTVGRTGIKHSPPHLHLELRSDVRLYDARRVLPELLIGKPPSDRPRRKRIQPTYVSAP